MLALALTVPAFALEESDVEAAVSSSGREAVTGNVLVWFLCAVGFLKVSQKIDSFMASIGVNVGHTGGSMLGEAMVAFKGVSLAAGMAGKLSGTLPTEPPAAQAPPHPDLPAFCKVVWPALSVGKSPMMP